MTTQIPRTSDGRFQSAANMTEAKEAETPYQPAGNYGKGMEDEAAGLPTQERMEPTARKSPIQWPKKAAGAEERHKGYLSELERLEGKLEGTARELFEEGVLEDGRRDLHGDGKEEMSMEDMLWEIEGGDMGGISGLSALERLFSALVLDGLQEDLADRMKKKYGKPYGTLDSLLKDVEEMFKEEVKTFKAATAAGGEDLREAVKVMIKHLSTGVGIRSVLISAIILRWWTRDETKAHAQSVLDVVQGLCRTQERDWGYFKTRCKNGEGVPRELLTDKSVVGETGYEALVPREGNAGLDRRWTVMLICALEVLCQEVIIPITKGRALEKWRVDGPAHLLNQKSGETVEQLLARLRKGKQELRKDLKSVNWSGHDCHCS